MIRSPYKPSHSQFKSIHDMALRSSNSHVIRVLEGVAAGKIARNLLLYGPPGSGKSTLAARLPYFHENAFGGSEPDARLIECDYEFDVPGTLNTYSELTTYSCTTWFIFDETDKVSGSKVDKLHSFLAYNEIAYPSILVANDIRTIPDTIKSRCQVLRIEVPGPEDYLKVAMRHPAVVAAKCTEQDVLQFLERTSRHVADMRHYARMLADFAATL